MATISHPTTRLWTPASADFGIRQSVILSTSPLDGQTQTAEVLGARWVCTVTYTAANNGDRAQFEGLFAALRAQVNRLSMGHPLRRLPRGTMRGSPTTSGSTSALSNTVNIAATTGQTLLAGDMIGIGTQLFMVTANAVSVAGVMTGVNISAPVRTAITAGTAVVWDWPRALWIVNGDSVRVPLTPVASPAFSVDLVEVFS